MLALVRRVRRMDPSDVCPKVRRSAEAPVAVDTSVGSLACVNPQVNQEAVPPGEPFWAQVARVRGLPRVHHKVAFEVALERELFLAVTARMQSDCIVGGKDVRQQGEPSSKSGRAQAADVWCLTRVRTLVYL